MNNECPISRKQRDSNIELLRIVAMLMILTLHTRFEGIEAVYDGIIDANHLCRFSFQALSVVGVNLFVLISGYFGIKPRKSSIINLLFQIVYIAVICLIIRFVVSNMGETAQSGGGNINIGIKDFFPVTNIVWFVPSYIMLIIFSPMLNLFIERTSTKHLALYTIGLYALTYYWDSIWVGTVQGFGSYSWGWFIILYYTGRIIRRLLDEGRLSYKYLSLLCYFFLTANIVVVALIQNHITAGRSLLWVYNCPLVYASSIFLFIFFCQLNIGYNRVINFFGRSAFAVLLFHMALFSSYKYYAKEIYESYNGLACIVITSVFILLVYLLASLIDQPRVYIYNHFLNKNK